MTYAPQKDKKAQNLSLLCIVIGFALMLFTSVLPYRAVYQVVAVLLVSAGVFLLVRYVLSEFRYIISDGEDGSADFVVYKKQGKNDVKVCHISLYNVRDIYKYSDKKVKSNKRFAYDQNITDNRYVLLVKENEMLIEIIIEPNEYFLEQIRKRVGVGTAGNNNLIM